MSAAVEQLAAASSADERGAIYTREEVVEFILDLCGYTADEPLHHKRLLEPALGHGDFVVPAVQRLLSAWRAAGSPGDPLESLGPCIRGVELHRQSFQRTKAALQRALQEEGIPMEAARALADRWLTCGDFLLADEPSDFDFVVGNPPYVRQELIPPALLAEYRQRYCTVFDRADLYIPFIERSLLLLKPGGVLGFICADRWMKNRYGGPLRELVAREFNLRFHVDMSGSPAFRSDVVAYPAVTIIGRESAGITRLARDPEISSVALSRLAKELLQGHAQPPGAQVQMLDRVAAGARPWVLDASDRLNLLRRLEDGFPTLEEAGCKVGIGVATGADRAFIGRFDELDVEDDRKLPLVMTKDLQTGRIVWRGNGVINPFQDGPGSGLVDLNDFPRLARYLCARREVIASRHVARKGPDQWYRTIDRITEALRWEAKLLIPDIKGSAQVVFDEGCFYPHHNLYYVTSKTWDLRALQAVLLSRVARLFVASYSTRMRGGFLRFQAQYLRRIRVPHWSDVPLTLRVELHEAAEALDLRACDEACDKLFGITPAEARSLSGDEA